MKTKLFATVAVVFWALAATVGLAQEQDDKLYVVTTLSTYADLAQRVGGDRVTVEALVVGGQDPHYVRPRPSLAEKLARTDLFVSTGLDLELWVPGLVDLSNNSEIRSGQRRYVSASQGLDLLEIPQVLSQSEGHVHIYGNPHFQLSPVRLRQVAQNIATGLGTIDPEYAATYQENATRVADHLEEKLVGPELLRLLGPPTVRRLLAKPDRFVEFVQTRDYRDEPLADKLGGWMKAAEPLRGRKIVAYHKNWSYFARLFGLEVVNYVEPRPGVPPRAEHVAKVIEQMREEHIQVLIAANYYDQGHVREIAERVGAIPVIVPLYPGGVEGVDTFEELMDHLIGEMVAAFEAADREG
jgi:ABC-type Zn uptake system ZnuABC Zn-binding protein ZnuA